MQVPAPYYPTPCANVQAALTTSYRAFACQNPPARVAPVGEAFARFWDSDNFLSLYKVQSYENIEECQENGGDHHPSLAGSYLSALTHYSALFNASAVGSRSSHPLQMLILSMTSSNTVPNLNVWMRYQFSLSPATLGA